MMARRRVGLLGGTFDPVHLGHLGAALAARQTLSLERVLLIPSNVPPHRPSGPEASGAHRLAMVSLAVGPIDGLEASDLELTRDGPSYSAMTLRTLHAEGFAPAELYFITGADAFAEIATWREFPGILDLAHFAVIARPGYDFRALRERLPELASRMRTPSRLRDAGAARQGEQEPSTNGPGAAGTAIWLVEARTPDVSSTEIRDRVRRGQSLAGRVPPLVERYILRHGLYEPPGAPGRGA